MTKERDASFDLRSEIGLASLPATPKLGLIEPHKPKLHLADYVHADAPAPPPAVHRSHREFAWPMLANDTIGDCAIAMMLHSVQAFRLDAGEKAPPFSDQDAIRAYSAITGYDPKDPATDQGTREADAIAYWQSKGLRCARDKSTHKVAATVAVNPQNIAECQRAIWEFVALQVGIAMPISAQGQAKWNIIDPTLSGNAAPGSWGGHAVCALSYDGLFFSPITWGQAILESYAFHLAYCSEAHVVITKDMLNRTGTSPAGVQWDRLVKDINSL